MSLLYKYDISTFTVSSVVRVVEFPPDLMTDKNKDSRRLRVDVGQTGFFAGRSFRTFKEYTIPTATAVVIQITVPVDIILEGMGIQVDDGHIHLYAYAGDATPSGSFSNSLPVIGANRMLSRPAPYYTSVVTAADGGSITGGTLLDVLSVKTVNSSNQSTTQDAAVAGERGLPPGTYYIKLLNTSTGDASVIFKARWEERN